MAIKGIIFDLDGVIVHTDQYHYQAWKALADRMGISFDETINQRLRGVSRMESLDIILEQYEGPVLSNREKEKLAEEKNRLYCGFLENMRPGDVDETVRWTLGLLKKRGYALAIGSSSKNAKFILTRTGMMEMFDAVSDGTNITKSKPDPEVFLTAAEYLKLSPEECAVIEDADAGIRAAKAGGMMAVAIGRAADGEKADKQIDSLEELTEIFKTEL